VKKILLLTTGGTIASLPTGEGLAPGMEGGDLVQLIGNIASQYQITVRDLLHLDSSNIQPEEWQAIAQAVYESRNSYDGVVITHGTDTMAYTSSALSFMLLNIRIPVVLTGAQLSIDNPLTDAVENLRTALAMAASGTPGIFLAFNRVVIRGSRAVKTRTTNFNAFESVNCPYAAYVDGGGLHIDPNLPKPSAPCELRDKLCQNVFLIKLTPGFDPRIFDMLIEMKYRGIVIEAFGSGGLNFIRRDLIAELCKVREAGISVVVCSQCLYESSNLSLYQTGQKALEQGVVESYDMTTEAAVTKLMWVLGQVDDHDLKSVRECFATNMAGEIDA
jgi:L-asparaginase